MILFTSPLGVYLSLETTEDLVEGILKKRLDRTICNQQLLDLCATISCSTLTKTSSDHYPILLDFSLSTQTFASNFKFLKMWTLHKDCKQLVSDTWNTRVIVCPLHILSTKLKILKDKLKLWNKDVFGNIHGYVSEVEAKLAAIQHQIHLNGHNDSLMIEEKNAQCILEDALNKHDLFWKEKARINWHLDGDRNTKFFHRVTKIKNETKLISSLRNGDEIMSDPQRISSHVINYYENLFSTNFGLQDPLLAKEVIPTIVDSSTNRLLTMIPSLREIKDDVFDLNSNSAPGPDGFGAAFFQTYWEIVNTDVIAAVLNFFRQVGFPITSMQIP